jgi:hypothetical protein
MNAGYATDGVGIGKFVLIDTGNVEDADNATLYIKTDTRYQFITDLSGTQGIQGPRGPQGVQGPQGAQGLQGIPGVQGPAGYTPVRGTDYWTDADVADMVTSVIAALPKYNGEVVEV